MTGSPPRRVAVLLKQIPKAESISLGSDGRLERSGVELEMNPYCRRAVSQGVQLARAWDGECVVLTLGPASAEDVLREAIAWGADRGVLISDPAFAGSDTLATARALAAALAAQGSFDLVLTGRNSVDADTGQVGPELAELMNRPFLGGVRELSIDDTVVHATCEHDDRRLYATTALPAVLSCAERLCDPCKVPPEGRAAVSPERITVLSAADLGPGPWGQKGSPTEVGPVHRLVVERRRHMLRGTVPEQVAETVALLRESGALSVGERDRDSGIVPPSRSVEGGPVVGVVLEPGRRRLGEELLGAAADVAAEIGGSVTALAFGDDAALDRLGGAGADAVHTFRAALVEEDAAAALVPWCEKVEPWALLGPGTMWGREVASRVAARLGAGLTGDAVRLSVNDGRLVGWKPAFGGALVAAITSRSPVQLVTVRPGVLPVLRPRRSGEELKCTEAQVTPRRRVVHHEIRREDDVEALALADVVIGVGTGIQPEDYPQIEPLAALLGAELGATRKVTDRGWLPRARQIGVTGRSIAPRLYFALALSGKFNHMVGVRNAGFIVAVNADPEAFVFDHADVGIVGDWQQVIPQLAAALAREI